MNSIFSGISTCLRPSQDLSRVINYFWYLKIPQEQAFSGHLFYPNGEVVLALNLADPVLFNDVGDPQRRRSFQSVLVGHHPRGLLLNRTGEVEWLCIYLNTEFVGQLNRFALDELTHTYLLTPEEAFGRLGKDLDEEVHQAATIGGRIERVEQYFRRFVSTDVAENPAFLTAKSRLHRSDGQLGMAELSAQTGISYKSLQRLFVGRMGLPPKQYARILRFLRVYDQYKTRSYDDLLGLAVRGGYYDHSHFLRDFTYFTNTTPSLYAQTQPSTLFEPLQQLSRVETTVIQRA